MAVGGSLAIGHRPPPHPVSWKACCVCTCGSGSARPTSGNLKGLSPELPLGTAGRVTQVPGEGCSAGPRGRDPGSDPVGLNCLAWEVGARDYLGRGRAASPTVPDPGPPLRCPPTSSCCCSSLAPPWGARTPRTGEKGRRPRAGWEGTPGHTPRACRGRCRNRCSPLLAPQAAPAPVSSAPPLLTGHLPDARPAAPPALGQRAPRQGALREGGPRAPGPPQLRAPPAPPGPRPAPARASGCPADLELLRPVMPGGAEY